MTVRHGVTSLAANSALPQPQLHEAWESAKHRGDLRRQAECCRDLAAASRNTGDEVSAACFLQLAARAEMASWRPAECSLSSDQLLHCSTSAAIAGESGRAFALCRAAGELSSARPDDVHRQLAALELRFGLLHAARKELIAAYKAAVRSGDGAAAAAVLEDLGHVECAGNRIADAARFFLAAADRFLRLGDRDRADRAAAWRREARTSARIRNIDPLLN